VKRGRGVPFYNRTLIFLDVYLEIISFRWHSFDITLMSLRVSLSIPKNSRTFHLGQGKFGMITLAYRETGKFWSSLLCISFLLAIFLSTPAAMAQTQQQPFLFASTTVNGQEVVGVFRPNPPELGDHGASDSHRRESHHQHSGKRELQVQDALRHLHAYGHSR
jgi:hypothetical protein